MKRSYQAIFFDLDGTLFDLIGCERETVARLLTESAPDWGQEKRAAFLAAYARLSPSHWADGLAAERSREAIVDGIFAAVRAETGLAQPALAAPATRYWQIFADVAVLEAGAAEIVAALAPRYRLGVISNGYRDSQRPRLHAAGLAGYFQAVVISGEVGWAKPDPAIFRHALAQLGVTPEESLYVGDSLSHDLRGALNAGLDFCLYRPRGGAGVDLPLGVGLVTALSQLAALLA